MAKSSVEILNLFQRKLRTLEQIRKKQETLFLKNQIVCRDIEEVYAAIYLDVIASFEALIGELFIGLLAGQVRSRHSNVNVRVKIQSYVVARDVFFRGRKYFNWLPYKHTEEVAKVFFTGGRPFTLITEDEKKRLDKYLIIRHAIAHQSRHSINTFRQEVLVGLTLTPRDKRPKSFLRSQFSIAPPTTYYQQLTREILKIANTLC